MITHDFELRCEIENAGGFLGNLSLLDEDPPHPAACVQAQLLSVGPVYIPA